MEAQAQGQDDDELSTVATTGGVRCSSRASAPFVFPSETASASGQPAATLAISPSTLSAVGR
jgi:hypothetical protein